MDITLTPQFSATYIPDYADESSFVKVDTSTITDYPSGGYGAHARLVYVVGGNTSLVGELSGLIVGGGGGGGSLPPVDTSPQRLADILTVNSDGVLAAGKQKHVFMFSQNYTGTILGTIFDGSIDTSLTIEAPATDFLTVIPYTVSSGALRIASISGLDGTTGIPSVQRNASIYSVNIDGTISAGSRRVTIIFSSDFTGTILSAPFIGANDSSITFDAPGDDTLEAIDYTITAGSLRIVTITGGSATSDSQVRNIVINDVTTSGTVAAGKRKIDFIFSVDYDGTVLSTAFSGANDNVITFEAPNPDTLAAIDYTITTGSIRLISLEGGSSLPLPSQRSFFINTVVSSGTVAAGAREIVLVFNNDFIGTVLGTDFVGLNDSSITFKAPDGDTLAAVPYIINAGSMKIIFQTGGTTASTSAQRIPSISNLISSGTIASGTRKLTLIFSTDFSILGTVFNGFTDSALILDAPDGSILYNIPYVVTTGSIRAISITGGSTTSSTARIPSISVVNMSGTIPAGSRKLTLRLSSDFVGTILQSPFSGADVEVILDAPIGDILDAVPFTIDLGNIRIIKIQ